MVIQKKKGKVAKKVLSNKAVKVDTINVSNVVIDNVKINNVKLGLDNEVEDSKLILKNWGLSALADISFVGIILFVAFLLSKFISFLPLYKFVIQNSPDSVLVNPSILPSDAVLYSNVIFVILSFIVLLLAIYFSFVFTRHVFYKRELSGYWKSTLAMLVGFFILLLPLAVVVFIVVALSYLIVGLLPVGISEPVGQLVAWFFFTMLLIVCGVYFAKSLRLKLFDSVRIAYSSLFKQWKLYLMGAGIILVVQLMLFIFQKYFLIRFVTNPITENVWYAVTALLMFSWIRIYGIYIASKCE